MRREFFMLGEEHVERLLATVKEDLDPEITPRRGANLLRATPRRLSENGAGPLHFNLRDLSPRLETLVTRTPRDLPLGQRPN